jgi:hypothetical protein
VPRKSKNETTPTVAVDSAPVYFVQITDEADETIQYAHSFGDFAGMAYAVRAGLKRIEAEGQEGSEYRATITTVDRIGDETPTRTVCNVTGDADVLAFVVKKKVTKERKLYAPDEPETTDASAEAVSADTAPVDATL